MWISFETWPTHHWHHSSTFHHASRLPKAWGHYWSSHVRNLKFVYLILPRATIGDHPTVSQSLRESQMVEIKQLDYFESLLLLQGDTGGTPWITVMLFCFYDLFNLNVLSILILLHLVTLSIVVWTRKDLLWEALALNYFGAKQFNPQCISTMFATGLYLGKWFARLVENTKEGSLYIIKL